MLGVTGYYGLPVGVIEIVARSMSDYTRLVGGHKKSGGDIEIRGRACEDPVDVVLCFMVIDSRHVDESGAVAVAATTFLCSMENKETCALAEVEDQKGDFDFPEKVVIEEELVEEVSQPTLDVTDT
ncbi:hypothetical protein Dimus_033884 [Dionaea muscipula]